MVDGKLLRSGLVGDGGDGTGVGPADAAELARICALNALAAIASVAGPGGVDEIERVIKVVGFVASAPGFTGQPGGRGRRQRAARRGLRRGRSKRPQCGRGGGAAAGRARGSRGDRRARVQTCLTSRLSFGHDGNGWRASPTRDPRRLARTPRRRAASADPRRGNDRPACVTAPTGSRPTCCGGLSSMAFAAGMHVFPGGRVDPADADSAHRLVRSRARGVGRRLLSADASLARGLVCAAVRETFEESGVLLAGAEPDDVADVAGPEWEADRLALIDRRESLSGLLSRRGLAAARRSAAPVGALDHPGDRAPALRHPLLRRCAPPGPAAPATWAARPTPPCG